MSELQEGGTRPPRESAPIYALPQETPKPRPLPACFAAAALVSYLPAYFYVKKVLFINAFADWGAPVFALLYILCVEAFAYVMHRDASKETPLWALGWLALSFAMWAYGWQGGGLAVWQMLAWHLFAVWYTLARCGMLAAGHSGSLSFLDALAGLFTVPWPGMTLRVKALWQGRQRRRERRAGQAKTPEERKRRRTVLASAALALALCLWAWSQLAAADANFAALGERLLGWLRWPDWRWLPDELSYIVLSIPVGAWLFGLVGGCLRRQELPLAATAFWQKLKPAQTLPALTVHWVLGSLCAVYALFFAVQAGSFAAAALPGGVLHLTAPAASDFAVGGFWQLCRVLLLDFALLAALRFFGPALLQKRSVKALAAVFCGFGIAFALLAAVKLGVYIRLYALTPRRAVSAWFVCVLLFWAVLALLWVLGVKIPFGPARLGIYGFVLAFLLLSALNVKGLVVRVDVALYNAGQANALDAGALAQCVGVEYSAGIPGEQAQYAALLQQSGWFTGRSSDEIWRLYDSGTALTPTGRKEWGIPGDCTYTVAVSPGCTLEFTFKDGICTGSTLAQK